jgi:hypothetical protein
MMRSFLDRWLLPFSIAISIPYLVALHQFGSAAMPWAALLPLVASLVVTGVILWPRKSKENRVSASEGRNVTRELNCCSSPPPERVPKKFSPHLLCDLYKRFGQKDADKILEPHKNQLMTVSGKVVYFSDRYIYLERKFLWHADRARVYLDFGKPDSVTALLQGRSVKVRGLLTSAWDYDITLMDAELLNAPKL